jgi:hypothetical protein
MVNNIKLTQDTDPLVEVYVFRDDIPIAAGGAAKVLDDKGVVRGSITIIGNAHVFTFINQGDGKQTGVNKNARLSDWDTATINVHSAYASASGTVASSSFGAGLWKAELVLDGKLLKFTFV